MVPMTALEGKMIDNPEQGGKVHSCPEAEACRIAAK